MGEIPPGYPTSDPTFRRLCGWQRVRDVPSEATFSRAFKEFAEQLVGHKSRDATATDAREKPVRKKKEPERLKRKRGRSPKGEEPPKQPSRLERQRTMCMEELLQELKKPCTVGVKQNAKGYKQKWTGYKLHMDAADGGVPISCIVSSASLHDSQAAYRRRR